ncbi:MAG: peptide chain release factor 2 [Candidatus Acidiferrales bacterium]
MKSIEELEQEFERLRARAGELRSYLDAPRLKAELSSLDEKIHRPDLWSNPDEAQRLLQQRKNIERRLETDAQLERDLADLAALLELAHEGESVEAEFAAELDKCRADIDELETTTLLSGPHDHLNAIVTIHPGAGGTESQDWAEMLLRMYLRWAERKGFKATITDITPGDEAGLKSVTFTVQGDYAFGLLMGEIGVHRLVRISPFDAAARRHTSFASVFVTPEIDDKIEIDLKPEDLRIDTFRASGHGGQHVNVTDSAVRITHLPTGLVAQCQNERSQYKNKDVAMKILRSRIYQYELDKRLEAARKLEETKADISFGSQIRSYVLHPYRLIKDHRTKFEVGDVDSVLDGYLDPFIRSYLVARRQGSVPPPYPMEEPPG